MKTGQERKDYWNQKYYEYWKSRVDEVGGEGRDSRIIEGDAKTEDDEVYESIFKKHPFDPGNLLEVGCAWGRMFPVYKSYGLNIHGVDISPAMIEQAKLKFADDPQVKSLVETEAEKIPFEDEYFDNVVCLATFDATFQRKALQEFLRVLKTDSQLYLTGKNSRYHEDDQMALNAEIGARKKGHPNFFTDVPRMIDILNNKGHLIQEGYFFPRRGDFGKNRFETEIPNKFYEWFLVIQKGSSQLDFDEFASDFSHTCKTLNPAM